MQNSQSSLFFFFFLVLRKKACALSMRPGNAFTTLIQVGRIMCLRHLQITGTHSCEPTIVPLSSHDNAEVVSPDLPSITKPLSHVTCTGFRKPSHPKAGRVSDSFKHSASYRTAACPSSDPKLDSKPPMLPIKSFTQHFGLSKRVFGHQAAGVWSTSPRSLTSW